MGIYKFRWFVLSCLLFMSTNGMAADTKQQMLERNFDFVETFDQLQDWDGNNRYGYNYGTTYAPKKIDGSNSRWIYFTNDIGALQITGASGGFSFGERVTGNVSKASYPVNSVWNEKGLTYLKLNPGTGAFLPGETITSTGGATAKVVGKPKWIGDHGPEFVWRGTGKSARINYADFSPSGTNLQELHNVAGFGPSRLGLFLGDGVTGKSGYKKIYLFMMVKFHPGFFKQNVDGTFAYTGALKFFDLCSGFTAPNYWGTTLEHVTTTGTDQTNTEYGPNYTIFNAFGGGASTPKRLYIQENTRVASNTGSGWVGAATPYAGRALSNSVTRSTDIDPYYLANQWFGLEVAVDIGTPDASNGTIDFWIYDEKGTEKGHFLATGENRLVKFDHYYNKITLGGNRLCGNYGACPQGQDNRWYVDDLIVNKDRIGPKYFSMFLSPSAPQNLRLVK